MNKYRLTKILDGNSEVYSIEWMFASDKNKEWRTLKRFSELNDAKAYFNSKAKGLELHPVTEVIEEYESY